MIAGSLRHPGKLGGNTAAGAWALSVTTAHTSTVRPSPAPTLPGPTPEHTLGYLNHRHR